MRRFVLVAFGGPDGTCPASGWCWSSARAGDGAAQVLISEAALRGGLAAIQIHEGSGYMRECELERMNRDVQLMTIGGGRSEIHRNMIVEQLLSAG